MLFPQAKSRPLWISLLGHILLLLCFLFTIGPRPMPEAREAPNSYVPAYVPPTPPTPPTPAPSAAKQPVPQSAAQTKPIETDTAGILAPPKEPLLTKQAMQAAVRHFKSTPALPLNKKAEDEPLNLIGDQKIVKPLIRLLARAVSHTLTYPKAAVDFFMRGKVLIGFRLSPDGSITDVQVLQSSGAGILDNEAARSIRAISPLVGAGEFVKEPQWLVVGIIFG